MDRLGSFVWAKKKRLEGAFFVEALGEWGEVGGVEALLFALRGGGSNSRPSHCERDCNPHPIPPINQIKPKNKKTHESLNSWVSQFQPDRQPRPD